MVDIEKNINHVQGFDPSSTRFCCYNMYGRKLAAFQQGKEVDVVLLLRPICTVHAWPHDSTSDQHRQIAPPKKKIHFLTGWADLGWGHSFFFRRSHFCWCFDHRFNTLQLEKTCRELSMADAHFFWEVHQLNIPVCNYAASLSRKSRHLWKNTITMVWVCLALLNRRFSLGVQGIRGTSFSEPGGGGVWFRVNGLNGCEGVDEWVKKMGWHHTVDGSEIPNNHLEMVLTPCK